MLVKYITFAPYENAELTLQTVELNKRIYSSDDPLSENYSPERFDLDNQLAITLGFDGDEPVYLSTLYKRDIYLPGIARTMNRVWKHPRLRAPSFGKHIKDSDITSLQVVPAHMPFARMNGIDTLFISIEGGAHRYLGYVARKLTEATGIPWLAPIDGIPVYPSCFQHICYCRLNPPFASETSEQQEPLRII